MKIVQSKYSTFSVMVMLLVTGTFAPRNFRSWERKFHGVELSLPGAKVPWNFRSLELSFRTPKFVQSVFESITVGVNITKFGKLIKVLTTMSVKVYSA